MEKPKHSIVMKYWLVIFGLSFNFLFYGSLQATITLTNNCAYTIWPGTLKGNGPQLQETGFELRSKATRALNVPAPFTGRFWARTQCAPDSTGKLKCATGDCGTGQVQCNGAGGRPPVSLMEVTLASNNGQDFYDVSLVDGFNVPLSVSPQGGSGSNCTTASCAGNVNAVCPSVLAVMGSNGVIACKSACEAFNQPQYCCTGSYASPDTCKPTNYSMTFKRQCPQAYSYAYDDRSSTFSCNGAPNYVVTFCP